jgi:FtsP/CotA-like multicopper oxidase with cupredoxin domain
MQILHTLFLFQFLLSKCYAQQGPGSLFYSGSTLSQPDVLKSSNGVLSVTLTVTTYQFTGYINYTTRAYSYSSTSYSSSKTSIPGPTLSLYPGDTLIVNLVNNLSSDGTSTSANYTNFHTHGLRGNFNVDSALNTVAPGSSSTYTYLIPSDHAPGIHWYHSHPMGSSAVFILLIISV